MKIDGTLKPQFREMGEKDKEERGERGKEVKGGSEYCESGRCQSQKVSEVNEVVSAYGNY